MVVAAAAGHPLDMNSTTHIPEIRRLQRSRSDRKVAGVSGGLAQYFEIHPAVFRVGFVVLTLLGGAGILLYAAAALVMPDEGNDDSFATAALRDRRDRPWPLIGLGFLAVAGAILLSRVSLSLNGGSWFLFLVAGVVILWITRQPAAKRTASTASTLDVGVADPAISPTELAKKDSRRMRRLGKWLLITFATLFALVLIAVAAFFAIFDVELGNGVGDRNIAITSAEGLQSNYALGIGKLDLDLRQLKLPVGETHISGRVDVGDLHVLVPADATLRIHGSAELGEVDLPNGIGGDGRNVESNLVETGLRVLVIDGHVGVGSVRIERALR
jgi:phage shock protein PspC (stress-responsive transcriptional regulator)